MASHYSFFMGDLNFRTKLPDKEAGSEEHIAASHELVAKKDWAELNQHDELVKALLEKKCLVGWKTPYCNFDPTFKVTREDGYTYNPLRSPSYTDRILYKTIDQLDESVKISLYEPVSTFTTSDHKPIRGAYEVQLNEKLELKSDKSLPLSSLNAKQTLHMLFTSIECEIDEAQYTNSQQGDDEEPQEVKPPNPFVSFISTPREALEIDKSSKKKSSWKRFGAKKLKKSKKKAHDGKGKSEDERGSPLASWPGTNVKPTSFKAKWNEEIHFEVKTQKEDETPIDLSGSLLHISVFNDKGSEPKLLGSFTFNLAIMIKTSQEEKDDDARNADYSLTEAGSRHVRAVGKTENKIERAGMPSRRPSFRLQSRPSMRMLSLLEDADELCADEKEANELKNLKITTIRIEEILTDGGKEIGRIKCTADAWWTETEEEQNSIIEEEE